MKIYPISALRRFLFIISASFLIVILLVAFFKDSFPSLADDEKIVNQPASEGRAITPAGELVMDATTGEPAIGALTMDFVRSPDKFGADGKGRFLLAVNSGFGVQFDAESNRAEQSIAVIDLNAKPASQVIQNVYFPTPQSVNVGVRFHPAPDADGNYRLLASGGFENKVWIFSFNPNAAKPIAPTSDGKDEKGETTRITAPFIDVGGLATNAPSPNYNSNTAAIYPTGIALSPDGDTLFTANNLGDTLGIVGDLRDTRKLERVSLVRPRSKQFVYPYDVEVLPGADGKRAAKAYVSLWGDGSIAVVDLSNQNRISHIVVERHPTAMILNEAKTRLFVVNSNHDSVSIIDTKSDQVIENINLKLAETENIGASPEGLALSADEKTLYQRLAERPFQAALGEGGG